MKKAAEQGDAAAQFNLGQIYYSGEEVAQDYAEAMRWVSMGSTRYSSGD